MEPLNLTPQELADRWRMDSQTLANWRTRGAGPNYIKLGGIILYPLVMVEAYEKQNVVTSTPGAESSPGPKLTTMPLLDGRELHLNPDELAERWHLSRGTLASWRCKGGGPRFIKFGRRPLYPISEVERFERENLRAATHVPAKG